MVIKKKKASKKVINSGKENVKKEFDEFTKKVAKLEALRQELNAMDTKGFDNDVAIIKAKLKNIEAIPEIEKELDSLRKKIEYKKDYKRKKDMVNVALVKESQSMKRKISELENKVEKKRRVSCKKQLSDKEVDYVKDIPKLESELKALEGELRKLHSSPKVKVDSGVGVLVDTKFDMFIDGIKGELSERLKQKEVAIDSQLKADIEEREKAFAKKYRDLVDEFHKRYEAQVHSELKKKVANEFNEKLNDRINSEKKKLIGGLVRDNARQLNDERKQLIGKITEKDREFIGKITEKDREKIEAIKKRMHDELGRRVSSRMKEEEKSLRKKLGNEYREKMKVEMDKRKAEIAKKKAELEKHVVAQAEKMKVEMDKRKAEIVKKKAELERHVVAQARKLFAGS